ncbi:hypothetical protein [Alkalihalobacillus deserti]|nr:hypothetical protein [Alkalihalobacillus deserti]
MFNYKGFVGGGMTRVPTQVRANGVHVARAIVRKDIKSRLKKVDQPF